MGGDDFAPMAGNIVLDAATGQESPMLLLCNQHLRAYFTRRRAIGCNQGGDGKAIEAVCLPQQ